MMIEYGADTAAIDFHSRRSVLMGIAAILSCPRGGYSMAELPVEVAGITRPRSVVARKALEFSRAQCPEFLFNHCMRTYLFGAVAMEHHKVPYDPDAAFVAASLHDLGLLAAFESVDGSFEIDGAERAAQLARDNGLDSRAVEAVWQAIVLHDGRFALAEHQGGEAMLVAMGAGSDVLGPDSGMIETRRVEEILEAFPRLKFKQRFTALAVMHCKRKPLSQRGTWLESLCREEVPSAWTSSLKQQIAAAPFSE
jgi:hypothetical protein